MNVEITYSPDDLITVSGENVAKIPYPGMICPECGRMAHWIQAEQGSHQVTAYFLILCDHRFDTQEWELRITEQNDQQTWTLEEKGS